MSDITTQIAYCSA